MWSWDVRGQAWFPAWVPSCLPCPCLKPRGAHAGEGSPVPMSPRLSASHLPHHGHEVTASPARKGRFCPDSAPPLSWRLSPRALDVPQYELFTFLCVFVSFFADPFWGVKRNGFSYILSRKKALGMEVLVPAAGFVPFRAAQSHLLPPSSVPPQGFQYCELFRGSPLTSAQLLASPNLGPCGEITFLGSTAICDRS